MGTKKIIGPLQMASLCILIRVFSQFAYTPINLTPENGCPKFLGNLFGFLLSLAMWIPGYFIYKNNQNYSIIDYSKAVSPTVGKITAILFYFATASIAIVTVAQFDYFITTTIYPNTPKLLYVVILILVGIYYSSRGLEPMSRVANIFFAMFLIALVFVFGMLIFKSNYTNLITPLYSGFMPIMSMGYSVAAQNTPLIVMLLLKPNIKEEKEKSYVSYIIITFIIFEIILFLIVTVLGEYAGSKPFPVYSLASATQGSILKRYDSIYMFVWIFTAIIRFSMFLYLSSKCAIEFLPDKIKNLRTTITAIIILIFSSITVFNINIFERVVKIATAGFILMFVGVVLPIILIFLKRRKEKAEMAGGTTDE